MSGAFLLLALTAVSADMYMHNPRGSNDRLNEGGTNRDNDNRMFNSQNNAKGGYGINTYSDSMYFYEGSWLTVEWTNQHACSNANTDCAVILQYTCVGADADATTLIRDGLTTQQITVQNYATVDPNTMKYTYGMHESLEYFERCSTRNRNPGLYLADQQLQGTTAQFTRQNNGGSTYGFECQEERDYYPYWHPSPWKDIAILTNDVTRCSYYQQNSQNVQPKGSCEHPNAQASLTDKLLAWTINNQTGCENSQYIWNEQGSQFYLAPPDCLVAPWSRDNHLGNGITTAGLAGFMNHYNFTLPTSEPCLANDNCRCVLRIRYNTSTHDYQGFGAQSGFGQYVDYTMNTGNSAGNPVPTTTNPTVQVGGVLLSHKMNTNQIARTFQDRSHMFELKQRPAGVTAAQRIVNLNVRGKRGNIVQTYPAIEYDFVPNFLVTRQWDYAHIQWTGFDNNPNNGNNNGEGTDGTDRANMCQITDMGINTCMCDTDACYTTANVQPLFEYLSDRSNFAYAGQQASNCDTSATLLMRNNNDPNQVNEDPRNCMKLNAAPATFDGGLVNMDRVGTYFYMSSRNNNFSNRSNKGSIVVLPILQPWAIAVIAIGALLLIGGLVSAALVVHGRKHPESAVNKYFDRI